MDPTIAVALAGAIGVAVAAWLGRRTASQTATVDINALIERIGNLEAELSDMKDEVARLRSREDMYLRRLLKAERRITLMESWIRAQGYDPQLIAPHEEGAK